MRRIILLSLIMAVAISPSAPSLADDQTGARPPTSAEDRVIRDALDRFAEAELDLPPLVIEVFDDTDGCGGNQGLYISGGPAHRVLLCNLHPAIVRHELAHVWEVTQVIDATRKAFLQHEGLSVWSSMSVPWGERGAERSAEVISFGLAEAPLDEYEASLHSDRLEAYELLTGKPSPRIVTVP